MDFANTPREITNGLRDSKITFSRILLLISVPFNERMILFSSTTLKNPYPNGILIERTTAKETSKPFLANLNGLYPVIKKVKAAARTIPVRLVMRDRKSVV